MTAPVPTGAQEGLQQHRRETRLQVWLPFAGAFVVVVLLVLLLVVPQDAGTQYRAQAIASLALTVLCVLPAIVMLMGVYALVVVSVIGLNRLHRMSIPPLQRVEQLAYQTRQKVDSWADRANHSAVRWGSMLAPLDRFFVRLEQILKEKDNVR